MTVQRDDSDQPTEPARGDAVAAEPRRQPEAAQTEDDPDAPGLSVLSGSMADPQDVAEPNEPA